MRRKRIVRSLMVALCCLSVVLLPYTVFATAVSDAQAINRYNSLAIKNMWLQAADYCAGHITGNDWTYANFSTDYSSTSTYRSSLLDKLNLHFSYGDNAVYSHYLESVSANTGNGFFGGGVDDGKVWCSELGDIFEKAFSDFGAYYDYVLRQTVCDSSLFEIYMGYASSYGSDWSYGRANSVMKHGGEYTWPDGWTEPSGDGALLDSATCNANYNNIISTLSSSDTYPTKNGKYFQILVHTKSNFKPSSWLRAFTGDLSSVSSQILHATQLISFNKFCEVTPLSKTDYDSKKSQGVSNIYAIYDDSSSIAEIKYLQMTSSAAGKELYASGDVTSSTESSCGDLASALSISNATSVSLLDSDKEAEITNCYDTAQENIKAIKKTRLYLQYILNSANNLITAAENNKNFRDTNTKGTTNYIRNYVSQIGGENSSSLSDFISITEQFEDIVNDYADKRWGSGSGGVTNEDTEDYNAAIDNYKGNVAIFESNILNAVSDKIDSIPSIILSSMYIAQQVPEGHSHIRDKVENFYEFNSDGSFTCIITDSILPNIKSEIEGITGGHIDGFSTYTPIDRTPADSSGENDTEPQCSDFAGALSWVVCPTTEAMANGTDGIYSIIKDFFKVDSRLVSSDESTSPAFQMWKYFRDIANVLLIIVIMIIIFSQLTGYGIDNYGIKKMLPRIIVAAVLINLSYIIGQACVDLSNVIGGSLSVFLDSIAETIANNISNVNYGEIVAAGFMSVFTAIIGVAAGVGGTIAGVVIAGVATGVGSGTFWMMMIPLIIGVLIAIISVLLFFIMLAARQLIVVLCVGIAPLAFVCYILPNTQKLFKRYIDIFKAMLLLYPICSGLYGISQLVKVIAFTTAGGTSIWMAIVAIVAPLLPFLAAPSLLKSSINAVGSLGAHISNLGNKIRSAGKSGQNAIRNTEAYKDAQRTANIARSQRIVDKLRRRQADGETLSKFQQRRLGLHQSSLLKARAEDLTTNAYTNPDFVKAAEAAQDSAESKRQLEAEMTNLKSATSNYSPAVMQTMLDEYLRGGHGALTDASGNITAAGVTARALMKKMATSGGFNQKNLASLIANAGAVGSDGKLKADRFSSDSLRFVSKFMQSDADVGAAITRKDAATAQYLRDINDNAYAGIKYQVRNADGTTSEVDLSTMSKQEWAASTMTAGTQARDTSNAQFVADNIVDKDEDFILQSDSAIKEAIRNGSIDQSRLRAIYNNKLLFNTGTKEARRVIAEGLGIKDYTADESDSGFPRELRVRNDKTGDSFTVDLGDIDHSDSGGSTA